MASDTGLLAYFAIAAQARAASYREKAGRLREMGEAEPIGRLRDSLFNLAGEFEALADSIDLKRPR